MTNEQDLQVCFADNNCYIQTPQLLLIGLIIFAGFYSQHFVQVCCCDQRFENMSAISSANKIIDIEGRSVVSQYAATMPGTSFCCTKQPVTHCKLWQVSTASKRTLQIAKYDVSKLILHIHDLHMFKRNFTKVIYGTNAGEIRIQ